MSEDFELDLNEDVVKEIPKVSDSEDPEKLSKALTDFKIESEWLANEFKRLKLEEESLDKTIGELEKEEKELQLQEQKYWKQYTNHRYELIAIEEECITINSCLFYTCKQLKKLQNENVFSTTFHITLSGTIGNINGFKLGHLPSAPVEWVEINSAWGQAALLLYAISNRMNVKFEKYCLVPNGNTSYIEVVSEKLILPLYSSGLFRIFANKKFDLAMAAFLECIQQFKLAIENISSHFHLPNKIENGKLKDPVTQKYFSVRLQFNTTENWTKALKLMLINLKSIVEWFSSQMALEQLL